VFAVMSRMDAIIAVAEGHPPPQAPLSCNTIGPVYCTACICCVESIFRDEPIVVPEFQHQKRSVFCISVRQPMVFGPLPESLLVSPCVLHRYTLRQLGKLQFCN
jgi:hypothetical protein